MKLRKLELKDAEYMLAWMHDKDVVEHLAANFAAKTINDCKGFILSSLEDTENLNLAIADETDRYMGTVSLKHIDYDNKTAEFAITVCKEAMGKGYSKFGMAEILKMGIYELKLSTIYWCVSAVNLRAVRFYDKCGYKRCEDIPEKISAPYKNTENLIWYCYEG